MKEDRVSTIPSAWVVKPNPMPTSGFPIDGKCYWKKKTSTWDTLLLAVASKSIYVRAWA